MVLISPWKTYSCTHLKHLAEVLLMRTRNVCFIGDMRKISSGESSPLISEALKLSKFDVMAKVKKKSFRNTGCEDLLYHKWHQAWSFSQGWGSPMHNGVPGTIYSSCGQTDSEGIGNDRVSLQIMLKWGHPLLSHTPVDTKLYKLWWASFHFDITYYLIYSNILSINC